MRPEPPNCDGPLSVILQRMARYFARFSAQLPALCGALAISCATAIEDEAPSIGDPGGGSSGSAGAASSAGSSSHGGSTSGSGGLGVAGSVSGAGGTTSSGGVAGKGGSGGSPFGGSAGTAGTSSGGGSGGASGSGTGGSPGGGTAGTGTSGGGSGGSGGTGQGCASLSPWASGTQYAVGAHVRGVCNDPGGGQTTCSQGTEYDWACLLATHCLNYAPGANGWWTIWNPVATCN
jgi:hypothetical protein